MRNEGLKARGSSGGSSHAASTSSASAPILGQEVGDELPFGVTVRHAGDEIAHPSGPSFDRLSFDRRGVSLPNASFRFGR